MILTARDEPTIVDEKALKEIDKLFSKGIRTKLRSKVGVRALPFFEFYLDLKRIHVGLPVDGDIHRDYMRRVNRLIRSVQLPPSVVNQLADSKKEMMTLLMRLRVGQNPMLWRRINEHFVPLFLEVAKSVGVYLEAQQRGSERWVVRFRPMNKKQVYLEELRLRDPETAALLEEYGKSLEQVDSKIEKTIKDATGSDPIKRFIMGRPVQIGKDSQTGEEFVYDRDGDVLPVEDYITKRKDQEEARKRLEKVKTRSDVNVDELRYVDPEVLTGETNWVALTDDKAKSSPMTRLFPVKDYLDESLSPPTRIKIVASGRYAGVALDDLVNQEGRLIEGTQYKLVPKGRGTGVRIPVKIDPAEREPYCTVATVQEQYDEETFVDAQKLYVKIPGGHQFKELRQAAKVIAGNVPPLTGSIPSIQYQSIKGTRAVGLYFEPKDFETVRNMLQSMSFSKAAVDFLEGHFRDLINANEIAAEENLKNYSLDSIGGFKPQFDLLAKQKEAIAWTELNGNRGVVALSTGVGKTLSAIATMQKLVRDGFADEDASYKDKLGNEVKTNGRFLYICPRDLKGNIGAEMKKFMESSKTSSMSKLASVPLRQQVDVLSFTEFARAAKKNAIPGPLRRNDYWKDKEEWNPKQYIGIFFDEAHQMTSGEMDAAREMYHPRKVILTASPMEDDPMQAWDLYAITNNKTLDASTMEGKKNRIERRRFRDRYCERVGRQIVGVKQNPLLMRELMIWTKRNIFSVKKTEVKEFALPELKKDVVSVEMDPEVEMMYREVTKVFSKLLKGMASRVKERGGSDMLPEARDPELEVLFTRSFAPIINLMNGLGKYPQKALLDMAYMMENGKTPKGRGIPKFMKKVLSSWGKKYSPQDLREMAMRASNPALNVCAQRVEDRLRESDGSGRSLIFSDDADMCENTAINISKKVPGRFVLGLKDEIRIYKNGREMDEIKVPVNLDTIEKIVGSREKAQDYYRKVGGWVVFKAPFKKRIYRLYPSLPEHKLYNPKSTAGEWQSFVLKNLISPDEKYKGLILYGPSYQVGQNLQAFDQVIHMDRDSWSDQNMEQREGRSWRQGQKYPVDVVYIDAKYSEAPGGQTRKDVDVTIDGLQGAVELIQSEMFASVIQAAQRLGQDDGRGLGAEWQEILRSDASNAKLQDKIVELMASPYI